MDGVSFTACNAQIINVKGEVELKVENCTFNGCGANGGALITIQSAKTFRLSAGCFQGTTNGLDINISSDSLN